MDRIPVSDFRRRLFEILDAAERGHEPVALTRNGKVVAVLSPPPPKARVPEIDKHMLTNFCIQYDVKSLSLFGSILREDFGPDSDVDVLFEPQPNKHYTYDEYLGMRDDLKSMFGREVDVINRAVLERSPNEIRKKEIIGTAKEILSLDKK